MNDSSLLCPNCRTFDWHRDGFALHEHPDGVVERRRIAPTADREAPWSCGRCSYTVRNLSVLDRQLSVSRAVHIE